MSPVLLHTVHAAVPARERQALELDDAVLQGMVVAKMALCLDDPRRAASSLDASIRSVSQLISDLLGPSVDGDVTRLMRGQAAIIGEAAEPAHE